mmetsp:Transcript_47337/g.146030  ORF Transcript_47337/g.146030 Transcript_47337/m.146030 type:complete len:286 (-) Transcript_47337:354-1211(-)
MPRAAPPRSSRRRRRGERQRLVARAPRERARALVALPRVVNSDAAQNREKRPSDAGCPSGDGDVYLLLRRLQLGVHGLTVAARGGEHVGQHLTVDGGDKVGRSAQRVALVGRRAERNRLQLPPERDAIGARARRRLDDEVRDGHERVHPRVRLGRHRARRGVDVTRGERGAHRGLRRVHHGVVGFIEDADDGECCRRDGGSAGVPDRACRRADAVEQRPRARLLRRGCRERPSRSHGDIWLRMAVAAGTRAAAHVDGRGKALSHHRGRARARRADDHAYAHVRQC